MKEIGGNFRLYYSRVSRILVELRLAKGRKDMTPKITKITAVRTMIEV